MPLSERGAREGAYLSHSGDVALLADGVAADISADVLDETVVADGHVAERGLSDAAVQVEAFGHFKGLLEYAEPHLSVESHVADIVWPEVLGHEDIPPVGGGASVVLQPFNLFYRQTSHRAYFFYDSKWS